MQIVPIMAHTLTSRPVITTGRDTITLKAKLPGNRTAVEVYGDGIALQTAYPDDGDEIEIKIAKNADVVKVYRPENWDFFNVLRDKMKW
jgi:NAD kinase